MSPTYINAAILEIGFVMTEQRPPWVGQDEFFTGDVNRGFEFINNESISNTIYSICKNKIITIDDIEINEITGELKENLFIITDILGIESGDPFQVNWIKECMSNGGFEDLDIDNMTNLYETSKKYFSFGVSKDVKTVAFIGMWEAHMSQGYFDIYPELEYIEFVGEGTIELVK